MSILYPGFLWLLIPLSLLFWTREKKIAETGHLIILMLLVLALGRPVIKQGIEESPIEAKEFIIALDVSHSMKAKDIKPDRYTFAKETAHALLASNPTDNIMLIAFTSNPLLLSPPTTDHRLISIALESLNLEYILTKGTSLEKLFKKVASINSHKRSEQKNLILITDGGEETDPEKLSTIIQNANISLTILGLGSRQGTTIENADGSLLKDKEHHLIISRINPLLKTLASQTGGTYMTASSTPASTAQALYDALEMDDQRGELITKKQHRYIELYQIPLLFALVLFLMLHTRAVKFLLLTFTLLGISAEASSLDNYYLDKAYQSYQNEEYNATVTHLTQLDTHSLQSRFALANTYYRQGNYKKALKNYLSIRSTSPLIKQKLYYNIANCYAKQEAYGKAKMYYTKALQLGDDKDAKANLILVALLADKKNAELGIAHPKSQSSDSSKSQQQEGNEEETRNEDEPSSGSGEGGEKSNTKEQEKSKLILDPKQEKQPLSSKVYELINKGYIREKQPW
ncbi:MAG: VWA domain-containing protein [Campylobacterota bacterium]|nr:VWA domain-containing protein [Campylobacterota bacterium]